MANGRIDAIMVQRGEEGHGIPMPEWRFGLHAVAGRAPTAQRRHVGLGPGLINEDKALGVHLALTALPPHPPSRHIGPVLFTGQHAFYLI
jgi:hypothetical protein